MHTIAGLIVGLALGILLMYFTISTVRVTGLKEAPPRVAEAVPAPPPLAQNLGEAAAGALAEAIGTPATVLVLSAGTEGATALATGALAGFRRAMAAQAGVTLVEVASADAAREHTADVSAIFCPDHGQLQALAAAGSASPLPPTYTVGWSAWLLSACAAEHAPVAGVAVLEPGAALRALTPQADAAGAVCPPAAALPVVVMTPAQFLAAFTVAARAADDPPAAAQP